MGPVVEMSRVKTEGKWLARLQEWVLDQPVYVTWMYSGAVYLAIFEISLHSSAVRVSCI